MQQRSGFSIYGLCTTGSVTIHQVSAVAAAHQRHHSKQAMCRPGQQATETGMRKPEVKRPVHDGRWVRDGHWVTTLGQSTPLAATLRSEQPSTGCSLFTSRLGKELEKES